jgi:hypothetical protein
MSQTPSKPANAGAAPAWDEKWMWQRTRRLFMGLVTAVVVLWLALLIWVLFVAQIANAAAQPLPVGADLFVVLAPVIAAAAGVERLLESTFNTIEGVWRTVVAYLGYGMRWLKSAETEVDEARQWLQSAGAIYNGTLATYNEKMKQLLADANLSGDVLALPERIATQLEAWKKEADEKTTAAKQLLQDAQKRLDDAEKKLASLTDSPDYKSAKAAASVVLGLMIGVVVAGVGQMQMFALLGIDAMPPNIDVLITGLVIGSGSYPVHSLVGILQQGKNTLDSLQGFLKQAGAKRAADEPQS